MEIKYLGHASFRLVINSKVIFIDPFAGEKSNYDMVADYVFITHEHFDHDDVSKIKKHKDTLIFYPSDVHHDELYKTLKFDDFTIFGVPAGNSNHDIKKCVGYILQSSNKVLYFAGDTSMLQTMGKLKDYHIDYAFLPCDGIYNMGPKEASEVAKLIEAKHIVPIHTSPVSFGKDKPTYSLEQAQKMTGDNIVILLPENTLTL